LRTCQPVLSAEDLAAERILITGASGFIGTNLLEFYRLWQVGAVVNFDMNVPRNPTHRSFWRDVDICDVDNLRKEVLMFRPTVVFHLAARTDLLGETAVDYSANSDGVRNLIRVLRALPYRPRLIVASSRLVCNIRHHPKTETDYCPPNAYGESKVQTELITRVECGNSIPWILVRPTSIWGPWFDIPYRGFFEAVRRRIYVHPGRARPRKSFGFVGNSVHQLDRLMFSSFSAAQGRTLYLTDAPTEVLPWARQIADAFGARPPLCVPHGLLTVAARIGYAFKTAGWKNPPLTSFRLDNLVTDMVIDYRQAGEFVGDSPYSLQDGIAVTVDWMLRTPISPARH
jgi:nucleoside-diphosphate-sugar epimerase